MYLQRRMFCCCRCLYLRLLRCVGFVAAAVCVCFCWCFIVFQGNGLIRFLVHAIRFIITRLLLFDIHGPGGSRNLLRGVRRTGCPKVLKNEQAPAQDGELEGLAVREVEQQWSQAFAPCEPQSYEDSPAGHVQRRLEPNLHHEPTTRKWYDQSWAKVPTCK